ncbi:HNH endonuclease [Paenibacillus ginsengarvi]|uniref:Putative HNH nuclease YajD n=1 Tax=Paenibacillus ginsengarvi TaxID=400777 RepID=A0A3B0CTK5_9BACL|nr:HNH endonuclease [Paenibacillus ginsengarvi]
MAIKKFCRKQGCNALVENAYCEAHKPEEHQRYDQYRESAAKRGYDSKWRKARVGWLLKHPLCVECEKQGNVREATIVDHIRPHKGDKALFWDKTNWQSLCATCHSQKTVREDGGFGNGR